MTLFGHQNLDHNYLQKLNHNTGKDRRFHKFKTKPEQLKTILKKTATRNKKNHQLYPQQQTCILNGLTAANDLYPFRFEALGLSGTCRWSRISFPHSLLELAPIADMSKRNDGVSALTGFLSVCVCVCACMRTCMCVYILYV